MREQFDFKYETKCDVECIFHLYEKFGIEECVKNLDGVFAFCIVDVPNQKVLLARDPYGVRPLFRFHNENGVLGICSEAKGKHCKFSNKIKVTTKNLRVNCNYAATKWF